MTPNIITTIAAAVGILVAMWTIANHFDKRNSDRFDAIEKRNADRFDALEKQITAAKETLRAEIGETRAALKLEIREAAERRVIRG